MAETNQSQAERITQGVLSKRTGCNIETVRYYERVGLMPEPRARPRLVHTYQPRIADDIGDKNCH